MKNVVLKYVSALLAVWYCLSIIGFDVHSCTTTGSIFVNSVLNGTTCDDIHPEHDCCGHGGCCSHHADEDGLRSADKECCTNEIEVLDGVVVTVADENDHLQFTDALSCLFVESNYDVLLLAESIDFSCAPGSGRVLVPDYQAVLNIWRI